MKQDKTLIFAIVFAGLAVSGSLIFLSSHVGAGGSASISQADIEKGIDEYVAAKQNEATSANDDTTTNIKGDYSDDDAFIGEDDAPVVMIEFSDFQCPFCRKFYNETFPEIKKKYVETGKVKFVYRDFPLSFHPGAVPAAMAAECAREQGGDQMLFAMHDKIFDGQNELGQGTVDIESESLVSYAEELGLEMDKFNDCVESEKFKSEIFADQVDGQAVGVTGTPGFLINGQVISGAQPFSVFESVIESELAE